MGVPEPEMVKSSRKALLPPRGGGWHSHPRHGQEAQECSWQRTQRPTRGSSFAGVTAQPAALPPSPPGDGCPQPEAALPLELGGGQAGFYLGGAPSHPGNRSQAFRLLSPTQSTSWGWGLGLC